jgi:hypothetical protein
MRRVGHIIWPMLESRNLGAGALLAMPAALMAYFAVNSGGFYPGPTAFAAIILCAIALIRVTFAARPLEGWGVGVTMAAGATALLAVLAILSSTWSHAPGVAIVEFDLPLVYALAMVICGSLGHSRGRVAWVLRVLAAAIVAICASGLITRVLPHFWPTTPELANNRLSFPVTYWNALGLLAVMGIVLSLHLSSDRQEHPVVRVLGAAALPILAATLFFTFSRGAMAVGVIVVIVYMLLGRPRYLLSALIASAPLMAVAIKVAYNANLLATPNPTTRLAVAQGRHVALVVLVCVLAAAAIRGVLLLLFDRRLDRIRLAPERQKRVARIGWISLATTGIIVVIAMSGTISHEYNRFLHRGGAGTTADLRTRLTDPGNTAGSTCGPSRGATSLTDRFWVAVPARS